MELSCRINYDTIDCSDTLNDFETQKPLNVKRQQTMKNTFTNGTQSLATLFRQTKNKIPKKRVRRFLMKQIKSVNFVDDIIASADCHR